MRHMITGLLVGVVAAMVAGCATTRPSAGLESRVQNLENRLQVVEADLQSGGSKSLESGMGAVSSGESASSSAKEMTQKDIQRALKNSGYYDGAIDGKIGPKTRAAIKAFQSDKGLKVDGVPGSQTKEKLVKYLS